jgi:AAA+ superfamily predicted ATPase
VANAASAFEAVPDPAYAWIEFGRAVVVDAVVARRDEGGNVSSPGVIDEARAHLHASLSEPSPFSIVAANARLTLGDAEVLALALACEADPDLHRLVGHLQDDPGKNRLTLGTVIKLFGDGGGTVLALAPDSRLRRAGLLDVVADGPWAEHAVTVHPPVVWALLGDVSADPDLSLDLTEVTSDESDGHPLLTVSGLDRLRNRRDAAHHCAGTRFIASPAPDSEAGWTALVREATITGRGVIVEVDDTLPVAGRRWIERAEHIPWAISSRTDLPIAELPSRPWVDVAVAASEATDDEWASALGPGVERTHRLTLDQLAKVSRAYPAVGDDIDAAVRRLVSGRLEHLARRIRPTRTWDDIVLSEDRMELLRSIVERYRFADQVYDEWGFSATPSRGLVALFSGPSGTGKTMAAEIIAGALALDVFKLDLSAVVSKYIGETEKNLEQAFDAASAGNLVLFFDEADALFGKRSEVKDARDRYANIEVSYLLQRLESYDGLVVMATNFEKNVDEAFLRRIHARIEFAMPGPAERRSIWEHNLPATAPVQDVDVEWLAAQFEMSGGGIRNAAVHAAFLAAAAGSQITMTCAIRGVAREYRKLGRLLKPSDFGEYHPLVATVGEAEESGRTARRAF